MNNYGFIYMQEKQDIYYMYFNTNKVIIFSDY